MIRDLLVYYEYNFDIKLLIQRIVVALSDSKEKVYQITLDTLSILHQRDPSKFVSALNMSDVPKETSQIIMASIKTGRIGFIGEDGNVHFRLGKSDKTNSKDTFNKLAPLKHTPSLPGSVEQLSFAPITFSEEYQSLAQKSHQNRVLEPTPKSKEHTTPESYTPSIGITRRRKDATKLIGKAEQISDLNVTDLEDDRVKVSNPLQGTLFNTLISTDAQNAPYDPLSSLRSRGRTRTFSARSNMVVPPSDDTSVTSDERYTI